MFGETSCRPDVIEPLAGPLRGPCRPIGIGRPSITAGLLWRPCWLAWLGSPALPGPIMALLISRQSRHLQKMKSVTKEQPKKNLRGLLLSP